MGRKSFNLDPLKSVGRGALHVAGIITVATIGASALMGALFGLVSFGKWMTAPSEEELKQQELDESISSYEAMDIEYKLMGSNIVRVNEGELTHYFHFSSGHVYAQNDPKEHNPDGQDAVFTNMQAIPFENIYRKEWINEVLQAGCEIARKPLEFPNDSEVKPSDLEKAQASASAFIELHCGE